jgi:hypothetical protein
VETATFSLKGGRVTVGIACKPKRDGTYAVTLWEANKNIEVAPSPWSGNFVNDDDDENQLPRGNRRNDGRLLECMAFVSVPPGTRPTRVSMYVRQDEKELGRVSQDIPPNSPAGQALMFIELRAK